MLLVILHILSHTAYSEEHACVTGEWDPNTSLLAHRMKELQGRRAYLKNFWYAAGECLLSCPPCSLHQQHHQHVSLPSVHSFLDEKHFVLCTCVLYLLLFS